MSDPDNNQELERFRGPDVTTGVRSSFDIPPQMHDVSNEPGGIQAHVDQSQFAPPPEPVMFSVERTLSERIAVLEFKVNALWEKFMDKPISLKEDEG